jgi:uncharacterized protein (TIGR02266 family)
VEQDHRRNFTRVPIEVQVDLRSESTFFTGFSENISEGGLFVATEIEHKLGDRLEIHLSLMGGEAVVLQGVVRWCRPKAGKGGLPAGIGLQFLDLDDVRRTALQGFVDSRLKDTLFYDLD